MAFTQRRELTQLVSKLAASLNVDRSMIFTAIADDVARMLGDPLQNPTLRLRTLESELREICAQEGQLLWNLRKIDGNLREAKVRLAKTSQDIETRTQQLATLVQEERQLRERLTALNETLRQAGKTKADLRFQAILAGQRQRERNGSSERRIRILLVLFTVIGVIIATILIRRLGK